MPFLDPHIPPTNERPTSHATLGPTQPLPSQKPLPPPDPLASPIYTHPPITALTLNTIHTHRNTGLIPLSLHTPLPINISAL
jgi:hypothetical protein